MDVCTFTISPSVTHYLRKNIMKCERCDYRCRDMRYAKEKFPFSHGMIIFVEGKFSYHYVDIYFCVAFSITDMKTRTKRLYTLSLWLRQNCVFHIFIDEGCLQSSRYILRATR